MTYGFLIKAGEPNFKKIGYEGGTTSDRLEWYKKKINCEWIEVVNLPLFIENSCLIVDEEGLLKDSPKLNKLASILYGTQRHGQPIVGDVLLLTLKYNDELMGVDTVGFDEKEAKQIENILTQIMEG